MIVNAGVAPNARIETSKLDKGRDFFTDPRALFPLGQRLVGGLVGPRFNPGNPAQNVLFLLANIVEGQTVTIGPIVLDDPVNPVTDIFEYDVVNTDSTINTSAGQWNNTNDPILVTMAAHGRSAGDLLRVENEIFKILRVVDVNTLVVARARCGTVAAAHADALDIFWSATPPASNIPVGVVATLTPAVAGPALAAEINNILSGNERPTAKASRIYKKLKMVSLATGAENVLSGVNVGVLTTACAEALAGAGNAWNAANLYAGAEPVEKKVLYVQRVPTAAEVTAGFMRFAVDFTPGRIDVLVLVTASGLETAWNGNRTFASGVVSIDNAGATDWATTSTVYVAIHEA